MVIGKGIVVYYASFIFSFEKLKKLLNLKQNNFRLPLFLCLFYHAAVARP